LPSPRSCSRSSHRVCLMWKVEMLTRKAGFWICDGKTFDHVRDALIHAAELKSRWGFVRDTRITVSLDGMNN